MLIILHCTKQVQLAHQIYDYVDRHIQKLDKELKAFDAEVENERARLGLPPLQPQLVASPMEGGAAVTEGRQRRRASSGGEPCSALVITPSPHHAFLPQQHS